MKTIVTLTLALCCLIWQPASAQWGKNKVKGNGNVTEQTISVDNYDKVKVTGSMDVTLQSGAEGTITVRTDSNLHEYLKIESNGNQLTIGIENGVSVYTKKGINISVPFESLDEVSLVGSGDVVTSDRIDATNFTTSVTGSGDVVLDVNAEQIDAKVTGSGDLVLKGATENLEVKVTGSGDFNGEDLRSNHTEAYVSGSGDAEVQAKDSLKARVNGSGDITYHGSPSRKDSKVMGSGSVSQN
ncbi:head GIN domain-containing protein [Luteirhabdus pelagi]|uniref:head GIN domain-containing protein n=1 Tax=Luteirhabdus pelagi TaxID=2792783 RepID=UPI001939FFEF|nr:head GIN domain-containing protein [Luteirhabdus pelagi]